MKKASIWIAVCFIFVALIVGAILAIVLLQPEEPMEDLGDSYDQDIRLINESHPVKIIIYGEPVLFRKEVKYFTVDHLSEDVLTIDDDNGDNYERVVLVVNDRNGTVNLSQEDLELISTAVNNEEIDLYYFGRNNREKLISSGIPAAGAIIQGVEDLSLVRVLHNNKMKNFIGFWTENDEINSRPNEEALGECIIDNIASCIKSNN